VIFAIRTRRIPFFRSHPSLPLTLAALGVVALGALLPATPLAHSLGFQPLPGGFFAALGGMVICYLALIEISKRVFYGAAPPVAPTPPHYTAHTATYVAAPPTSAPPPAGQTSRPPNPDTRSPTGTVRIGVCSEESAVSRARLRATLDDEVRRLL